MQLGALVVTQGSNPESGAVADSWISTWPVVGKTVVERWIDRVRELGVGMVSVVDREAERPIRIVDWAKEGVEQILLILSGAYAEIDLADLIHFHHEGQNRITRVFDKKGPLGISLLNRGAVLKGGVQCGLDQTLKSSRYDFLGYVSRLSSTMAYRQLVQDALEGRCEIQPTGYQADEKIWMDPSARVDASAKIQGPCYIGANTRIHAGVTVTGYSSIERNCEIDMGTSLDHACILPNTYLAPGLLIRNSVVDGTRLEQLEKGVTVDLGRAALAARRYPIVSTSSRTASDGDNIFPCNSAPGSQVPMTSQDVRHDS